MSQICPWWHVYTFDNPLRRLLHNPRTIFGPYVSVGMTVLDIGCGRGFNSIGLARIVGEEGRVIAVDVQQEMLNMLQRRSERAGLADRIHLHRCNADALGLEDTVDFVNAFWMVHEVPDIRAFAQQVHSILKKGGTFLIAEPWFHVSSSSFQKTITRVEDVGFKKCDAPRIALSKAAVMLRT